MAKNNGRRSDRHGPGRIFQVRVGNWRNFPEVDVAIERRMFVVGPNASGKSNLLDVFRFLHDVVSVGGGFQDAVERRGGVSRLRCLAARRSSDIVIEVRIGDLDRSEWRYLLHFSQDSRQTPLVKKECVWRNGEEVLRRPNQDDEKDPARLTQTHIEQVNVNKEFREVAEFLGSIKYLHIVPQLVREPDRSVGRRNDPYGGDFLEQVARTPEKTRTARLRRIGEALRIAVPQLRDIEMSRDQRGTPHLRGRYEHWRPHGAWQTEDQFSDGTLRLMGLLWAVLDGQGPLLLEEPELSLHSEVVRILPQMFARIQRQTGRQILVSTHSRDLLNDSSIGWDEVLLLIPTPDGTSVTLAQGFAEVRSLLEGGLSMGDIVIPKTRPADAAQLSLFAD